MAGAGRDANRNLQNLMGEVSEYGTNSANDLEAHSEAAGKQKRGSGFSGIGAGLATFVSIVALAFSGYSFYETSLKQAELRFYQPPLIYLYRQDYRDVFAIPVTISNDGARRGTVMSFDLEITHLGTQQKQTFQNLHFGSAPKGDIRLFTPITVPGGNSFTEVVLFHALETGSFVDTTGGVELPLRLKLTMNQDTSGDWYSAAQPAAVSFDMTATYIAGMRDMESGRPTQFHDTRWTQQRKKNN